MTTTKKVTKNVTITEKEIAVLDAILHNDFNPENEINNPVWTSIVQDETGYSGKVFSGLISSLTKKSMIIPSKAGNDDETILITESGKKAYEDFVNVSKSSTMQPDPSPEDALTNGKGTATKPPQEKPPKKESSPAAPSAFGTAVEIICSNPDISFADLTTAVQKKLKAEPNKSATRTAHSQVRKVIKLLKANGWAPSTK